MKLFRTLLVAFSWAVALLMLAAGVLSISR